ncbi:hypothetical protein [Bdellovibrio sp. HCB337]|uniref:hypothetical protein n=1 Tax=Bdellovibrio sp. HCB337 TaxID=3394358 RepID=UPI0039A53F64
MMARWFLVLTLATITACTAPKADEAASGDDSGDDTAQMEGSPLFIQVSSKYENSDLYANLGNCYLDSTTVFPATKACTIRVPELQLHFSDLSFRVGTGSTDTCALVSFQPYYYRKSDQAGFVPAPGVAAVDCTDSSLKECWGGAAPAIIENFPTVGGSYFLPDVMTETTYNLKSSNSRYILASGDDASLLTNVGVANNLIDLATPVVSPAYVGGGAYQDYQVTCEDEWAEVLYAITLTIADDDTEATLNTPAKDHYFDWGGL